MTNEELIAALRASDAELAALKHDLKRIKQSETEQLNRAERAEAALAASEDAQALTVAYMRGLADGKGAVNAAVAAAYRDAAAVGYIACAETRHVTLGQKVEAAIRALKGGAK